MHASYWLEDMIEAMRMVQSIVIENRNDFERYENDRRSQLLIEKNLEILSEASRHLPTELKQRYPEIEWEDIQNIGNKLRHEYHRLLQSVIWKTARVDVPELLKVCETELERVKSRNPQA